MDHAAWSNHAPQVQTLEFFDKFVTRHNNGQSMPFKAKEVLNKFLNGSGMNSRAFEEKVKNRSKVRG